MKRCITVPAKPKTSTQLARAGFAYAAPDEHADKAALEIHLDAWPTLSRLRSAGAQDDSARDVPSFS